MRRCLLALALVIAPTALLGQNTKGYYRFPAIRSGRIVFVAEGDLWTVPTSGGAATRLTTHPAEETHPAISPDGKWIAFSAAYEGPTDVYVMPADGGLPRRLTYEGGARVTGWTPDGTILYTTTVYSTLPNAQLVAIDPQSGVRTVLPLAQADDGSYGPHGTLYFTRFAAQSSHTKRYHGGTAQSIWKFGTDAKEAVDLTADYTGTSRTPMVYQGRVYFASDRDGTMNLWSMTPAGGDLRQLTHHVGWDVQSPALGDGKIVYQLGADLYVYDIATGRDRMVPITLVSDFDQMRQRWIAKPMEYLDTWHVSPTGDRLALVARGRVFVAPAHGGRFVEVTRNSGVRYRTARFLPDGKTLAVLSDESGEVEWWTVSALGVDTPKQVTHDGHVLRMEGVPSPDGKWLVSVNHDQEMWLVNLASGATKQIAFSPQWRYDTPRWSPDSRWLAYGKPADDGLMQLFLYEVSTGKTVPLTTDRYNNRSPTWSHDGKWIYFLSNRTFHSLVGAPWGSYQPEPYFDHQTAIYAAALVPAARSPFAPVDELTNATADSTGGKGPVTVTVDPRGLTDRLIKLDVPAGNYADLTANAHRLFWVERRTGSRNGSLVALDIARDAPKPKTLVEGVRGYELSGDGSKIALRHGSGFYVISAAARPGLKLDDARVDLSGWAFAIDPREDYHDLFVQSWRLERDYYYDPHMQGVDWKAMLKKYLPLVDRVRSRGDLADLQAQMAGELSTLHTFVYGGDYREGPEDISGATLGARLMRDDHGGGWRVTHIYRSDPDQPDAMSPLARYGVDAHDGDVITAINGVSTLSVSDPDALLRNQAGKEVRLHLHTASGAQRDVLVRPISTREDANLRYSEWEYTRRLATDSISHDSIGYVHLRAMGSGNIEEWYRNFYPVFTRQGLIVDVRHNRGGNIESWILEKLLRKAWMYWQRRVGDPYWNMQDAFRGHVIVLVDEHTASDGEAFAEGFKRLGLGKVLGTRTWGGEIWLSSSNRLADRGIVTAAEDGVYGPDGKWLIEGHGVDPDIVVDNLPHATFGGSDAQLQAAIAELRREIRADPRPVPPHPPYPDKSTPWNRAKGH